MKFVFLRLLPRPLCLKPHDAIDMNDDTSSASGQYASNIICLSSFIDISADISRFVGMVTSRRSSPYFLSVAQYLDSQVRLTQLAELRGMHPDLIRRMADNVAFIADHFRAHDKENLVNNHQIYLLLLFDLQISDDWSYVAMVIDRLLLIVFSIINITGTVLIILQSPVLYDNRLPLAIPPAAKPLGGDTFSFDTIINNTR
jgi:nicotinic acetylcholine receptor